MHFLDQIVDETLKNSSQHSGKTPFVEKKEQRKSPYLQVEIKAKKVSFSVHIQGGNPEPSSFFYDLLSDEEGKFLREHFDDQHFSLIDDFSPGSHYYWYLKDSLEIFISQTLGVGGDFINLGPLFPIEYVQKILQNTSGRDQVLYQYKKSKLIIGSEPIIAQNFKKFLVEGDIESFREVENFLPELERIFWNEILSLRRFWLKITSFLRMKNNGTIF